MSGFTVIFGIRIEPNGVLWNPDGVLPLGRRVIYVGDSFGEGTGSPNLAPGGFTIASAFAMGWYDAWVTAQGGAGYANPGPGGWSPPRSAIIDRIDRDVIAYTPDVVVINAGINDYSYSDPDTAAIITIEKLRDVYVRPLYEHIMEELPSVVLVIGGPWWATGSPPARIVQMRDMLKAETDSIGGTFIDNIGGDVPYNGTQSSYENVGWISGTGRVGNVQNNGNADYFTSTDGTHPSNQGHQYLGLRLAQAIASQRPGLVGRG